MNTTSEPAGYRQTLERLVPLVGVVLAAGALWLLLRELRGFHPSDVTAYLRDLPPARIALALALTAANYLTLTAYDALALRYAGQKLPYRRSALASFVGYAFSIALGHAVVTGGAVRYRFYTAWGVPGEAIAKVIAFCGLAFWVGYLSLGGVVFLIEPLPVPDGFPVSARLLGAAFLAVFLVYLALNALRTRPLVVRRFTIEPPGVAMTLGQAAIASVDLCLAAGVLWMLLPAASGVSFPRLLGIYLLAVIAGVVSSVPGGLGVFDGLLVAMLVPPLAAPVALGALIAYRAVYYLLPLTLAATIMAASEVVRGRAEWGLRLSAVARPVLTSRLVPRALAATTFLAGAVLLASGALPAEGERLAWLGRAVPLGVVETGHFVGSLVGAALLVLAHGLWRRLDAAWMLAVGLLSAGVAASLLRGLDWEEATLLALALALLVPARRSFTRRSALLEDTLSGGWLAAVGVVLASTVWLGLFAYSHVPYRDALWWRFALQADAPRFLRGTAGACVLVGIVAAVRLFRPASPRSHAPTGAELERAAAVVAHQGSTEASLVFLGDKRVLFPEPGPETVGDDGFLMYGHRGGTLVSMGPPIGAPAAREELAWRFLGLADRCGARPVFYQVGESDLPLMLDLGLGLYKLGEAAVVPLSPRDDRPAFSLDGGEHKKTRRIVRRTEELGFGLEVIEPPGARAILPELQAVSDAWLGGKATREKGFSLGRFDARYLARFPVAVVRAPDGRIVAFASLWANDRLRPDAEPAPEARQELSADLMRFDRERAPDGVMEYLFARLLLWGRDAGYQSFDLGMAPLSGLEPRAGSSRALAPLWNRLGAALFRHGEHFYNFQGLRAYKQKFGPEWKPYYLAGPRNLLALPGVLVDTAALIAGSLRGIVVG